MADQRQQEERFKTIRLSTTLMHPRLGTTSSLTVDEKSQVESMVLHRAGVLVTCKPVKPGEPHIKLIVPFAALVHMEVA